MDGLMLQLREYKKIINPYSQFSKSIMQKDIFYLKEYKTKPQDKIDIEIMQPI